jgi:hypothetical protein
VCRGLCSQDYVGITIVAFGDGLPGLLRHWHCLQGLRWGGGGARNVECGCMQWVVQLIGQPAILGCSTAGLVTQG